MKSHPAPPPAIETADALRRQRDLALSLSACSDLPSALDIMLGAALDISDLDCGGVYLMDRVRGGFRLATSHGLSQAFIDQTSYVEPETRCARLVLEGAPVYRSAEEEMKSLGEGVNHARRSEGLRATAAIPILAQQDVIGCLNVASRTLAHLPDATRRTLESIVSQAGGAIARIEVEATYRALVDATETGFAVLDQNGRVITANREYLRITGHERMEDILGRSVLGWTAPHDMERNTREFQDCLAAGAVRRLEIDYEGPSGAVTPVEINASTMETVAGTRVVCVCRDISEQRRTNSRLRSSEAMLRLVGVFRNATERRSRQATHQTVERLESLGLMAGGIAHDFNNLLLGITGTLGMARLRTGADEALGRLLGEAEQAAVKARELTQQLLVFARGGHPVRSEVRVEEVIRETTTLVLRCSPVRASYDLPADLRAVCADRGQLGQVIQNLVLNAAQAMPGGGTVRIGARNVKRRQTPGGPPTPYVRITVSDQGCGIPRDILGSIFDPYFTTKPTGSGLGLAVAHSVIKKHHGHIEVTSKPGEGSTFHVDLPAIEHPQPASAPRERSGEPRVGRVLIMDDDDMVRDVACQMLRALAVEVEPSRDGQEALRRFQEARDAGCPFDLVILDLTVPGGMGGMECWEHLRARDPAVKVVVSSGHSTDPRLAEHYERGLAGILEKPYRLEDLRALLRAI